MIKVGTLAKIRRLYFRDKLPIKEICRQTGLSRNTVRTWLREPDMVEPRYPARRVITKLDDYAQTLRTWLKADAGNVLARLKGNTVPNNLGDTLARELAQGWPLQLQEEPQANVARYDGLRMRHADSQIDRLVGGVIGEVMP